MKTVDLTAYLQRVERRKAASGLTDTPARVDALCNKGAHRTPEKRELLARAETRARAVGRAPVVAYY